MVSLMLLFFILEQFIFYKIVNEKNNLSEKQKAYILSLKSSITMFIGSLYSNYVFFTSNQSNISVFITKENFFDKLLTLSFISYLIVDVILGTLYYKKFLYNLAGYPHHLIYIGVSFLSLYQKSYKLLMLYMICELPTFILALGSYDKRYRQDKLFGLTFFFTRIVHFIYISSFVYNNKLYISIACIVLFVHTFWFYKWCKKYSHISTKHHKKKNKTL